ncbi:hypothetical protein EB151_00170 [archaeon]|nr:hypothetical protein [archaeon]
MKNYVDTWKNMVENLHNRTNEEISTDVKFIKEDSEANMMLTELKSIADKAEQVIEVIREDLEEFDEVEYDAWLQSKVTKCNDYMNTVFDYMMYSEDEEED